MSYKNLSLLNTFEERLTYLQSKCFGSVGFATFGANRWMNQELYQSEEWKQKRAEIISRDRGNDLGIDGEEIYGKVMVHHIEPVTTEDFINGNNEKIFGEDNLITVSMDTHNAVHYGGDEYMKKRSVIERAPNDTSPWKIKNRRNENGK